MAKDKIYQVFVSSTYEDLKEERFAVMNALIEKNCIPVGMEYFPASNMEQFEYIKKLIDEVDYYILIVAGKYGSIEKNSNKSYTQLEYEYAKSKKVPIASFVIQNTDVLVSAKVEKTTKKRKQLENFKQLVMADKMCKTWSNKDELARHVQNAIDELVESSPREGWVRQSSIVKQECNKVHEEFDLNKTVELHPVYNPFSIDNDELVQQTTWRDIIRVIVPVLDTPVTKYDIEKALFDAFKGISSNDTDSIIEQLICFGFVSKKSEGNYYSGYINVLTLTEKGWEVFGKAKSYL
jgi:hypothetical protein